MVKIRLTKTGRKHQPHYRIVAVDSRHKRDGDYIEKIGYYNPRTVPPTVQIDKDVLKKWMDNGAQLTDTIYDLLVREKIITTKDKLREKRIKLTIKQHKADAEKEAVASAPVEEAPKTEVKPAVEVVEPTKEEQIKTEEAVVAAPAKEEPVKVEEIKPADEVKTEQPEVKEEPVVTEVKKEEKKEEVKPEINASTGSAQEEPVKEETKSEEVKEDTSK